jgi:60 kDa SS-A/Ro ribonucleoprotein
MALVTMATEPDSAVVGFSNHLIPLSISPRQRLDDVMRDITGLPFGGTDCSLPPRWALKQRLEFDTFMVITDNETWSGLQHPHQALQEYRDKTGIPAKLVVVGTTATECSIANPSDPGMLDIAGFDTAVPQLVADFSRGV